MSSKLHTYVGLKIGYMKKNTANTNTMKNDAKEQQSNHTDEREKVDERPSAEKKHPQHGHKVRKINTFQLPLIC